jgi:hypothetical protein
MCKNEIEAEAEEILRSKYATRTAVLKSVKAAKNAEYNHTKVFRSDRAACWYIEDKTLPEIVTAPYGFIFADFFNLFKSLSSEKSFVSYVRRMFKPNGKVNPTFDKKYHFLPFAELQDANTLSDKALSEIYRKYSFLWDAFGSELETLEERLKEFLDCDLETRLKYATTYYRFFRTLILKIFTAILEEEYTPEEPALLEKLFYRTFETFRFCGYENLVMNDTGKTIPCEVFDCANMFYVVPEDFMRLLCGTTSFDFSFCPDCGSIFVHTAKNQRFCPICAPKTAKRSRVNHSARYIHKQILDLINSFAPDETMNTAFRAESNYYWSRVTNKNDKPREKGYSTRIKTEEDYISWLSDQKEKYRKMKRQK